MDLWIRSQTKEGLINANNICIRDNVKIVKYGNDLNLGNYALLGEYKTKERALEVLDEIQNMLKPKLLVKINEFDEQEVHEKIRTNIFYEMPKE
mgnify:CR=1 FL=1